MPKNFDDKNRKLKETKNKKSKKSQRRRENVIIRRPLPQNDPI